MKKFLIVLGFVFAGLASAEPLHFCHGEYALCAASATTPTGRIMHIYGKEFREGVAVCPILTGTSIANRNLTNGCTAPPGRVWSLFGFPPVASIPQAPTWEVLPAPSRTFVIGETPETGISNMWSFPCYRQAEPVNGVRLASCYGPIMESPITNNHVKPGQTGITQAPIGATWPVGSNAPRN